MKEHTVAIASDHAGFELKERLKQDIASLGYGVNDLGAAQGESADYPDYAHLLAAWIEANPGQKGVLVCGSGIGMSIAANRHREVRAALCHQAMEARLARQHNDANVLCLGARLIGSEVARDCLKTFLDTAFEGGRHVKRVEKLNAGVAEAQSP